MLMWHLTQNGCITSILITMWIYFLFWIFGHTSTSKSRLTKANASSWQKIRGHLNFLERIEEIGFFECRHFILNEIYPFLHNPYCRHNWHVNCILPFNTFEITILVIMMKPKFVQFNCCTFNNIPIANITRRMNATICSLWNDFGLAIVVSVLL